MMTSLFSILFQLKRNIKGRLEQLEEEKEFWDNKVGKLVRVIDDIKNFKDKFIQFEEDRRAQMLRLMVKKISSNSERVRVSERAYDKLHNIKRRKDVKQITVVWNEEFEELFDLGVIKRIKEWEQKPTETPKIGPTNGGIHPRLLKNTSKNNLLQKNKNIDFLFSIIYLLFII